MCIKLNLKEFIRKQRLYSERGTWAILRSFGQSSPHQRKHFQDYNTKLQFFLLRCILTSFILIHFSCEPFRHLNRNDKKHGLVLYSMRSPVLQFQLPTLLLVCVLLVLFVLIVLVFSGEPRQKQGRGLFDRKLVQAPQ